MSTETILIRGTRHVVWECGTCGVISTCPERVYDQHRAEGGYHFCCNGHQWGWSAERCERERLRQERNQLKQQLACKDDEIAAKTREAEAARREAARIKKRVNAGVCPCCSRSFQNLRRHMETKHPNVVELKKA